MHVDALPGQDGESKFHLQCSGTHLYWVETATVNLNYLLKEHNTMSSLEVYRTLLLTSDWHLIFPYIILLNHTLRP